MSTSTRIYACGNPSCPNGAYFPQEQLDRDHTNRIWMSPYVFFQPKKDGTRTDTCNRPIRVYQSRLETNGVTHARLDKVQNGKDKWILTVFKGQTLPWKEIAALNHTCPTFFQVSIWVLDPKIPHPAAPCTDGRAGEEKSLCGQHNDIEGSRTQPFYTDAIYTDASGTPYKIW